MSNSTIRTFSSFLPLFTHLIARLSQKRTKHLLRSFFIHCESNCVLEIITLFDDDYLMGDNQEEYELVDPCLEATDAEGYQYGEDELPAEFDA